MKKRFYNADHIDYFFSEIIKQNNRICVESKDQNKRRLAAASNGVLMAFRDEVLNTLTVYVLDETGRFKKEEKNETFVN